MTVASYIQTSQYMAIRWLCSPGSIAVVFIVDLVPIAGAVRKIVGSRMSRNTWVVFGPDWALCVAENWATLTTAP